MEGWSGYPLWHLAGAEEFCRTGQDGWAGVGTGVRYGKPGTSTLWGPGRGLSRPSLRGLREAVSVLAPTWPSGLAVVTSWNCPSSTPSWYKQSLLPHHSLPSVSPSENPLFTTGYAFVARTPVQPEGGAGADTRLPSCSCSHPLTEPASILGVTASLSQPPLCE